MLEIVRPYFPYKGQFVHQKIEVLEVELTRRIRDNSPFIYLDYQNPFYVSILTIVLPLVMLIAGILTWFSEPWVELLY